MSNEMKLTVEQEGIYKKILAWLTDPSNKEMILDAMAGTGKSFLIKYIQKNLVSNYKDMCKLLGIKSHFNNCLITATTNKAVSSLEEIGCKKVSTIYSALSLLVKYDLKTHKTVLTRRTNKLIDNSLIIIDECSMINWDLQQAILDCVDRDSCKIIYSGDRNQLNPVRCTGGTSPIYKNKNAEYSTLTTLIRSSKHKALQDLALQLHKTVKTGVFKPIKVTSGVVDWYTAVDDQKAELNKFKDANYDAKVITYTNSCVGLYTDYIRGLRNYTKPLEKGECYINNHFYLPCSAKPKVSIPSDSPIKILAIDNELKADLITKDVFIPYYSADISCPRGLITAKVIADKDKYRDTLKFLKRMKWFDLCNDVERNYLVLDYAHACTIHKAQGTTLDTVYIDCKDISTCRNPDTVARLLYVAATRAKNRVVFLNKLAPKFGGIVYDN